MSGIICPACQAANVMRQRMVFEGGTASTTSSTTGVGGAVIGGGLTPGLFAASSTGTQQSVLAKACAPPEKSPTGSIIGAGVFLLIVCVALSESGVAFAVCGILSALMFLAAIASFMQNRTEYPSKLAIYERRWVCLVCGHCWECDPPTVGTPSP